MKAGSNCLTECQIKDIIELYQSKKYSMTALAKQYNVGVGTISRIMTEHNVERHTCFSGVSRKGLDDEKNCFFCNRKSPNYAKYCCHCGKELILPKERVLKMLKGIFDHYQSLSKDTRDRYIKEVNTVIELVIKYL